MCGVSRPWIGAALLWALAAGPALGGPPHGGYPDADYERGPYLGASLGRSYVDEDLGGLEDFDVDETAWKVFLGYAANRYLRLEVGYIDFGKLEDSIDLGPIGPQPVRLDAEALTAGAQLDVPLSESVALFARGGVAFWEAAGSINSVGVVDEDEDPFYGIGARVRISPNLSIIGTYERYELGDLELDVPSLGFSFGF